MGKRVAFAFECSSQCCPSLLSTFRDRHAGGPRPGKQAPPAQSSESTDPADPASKTGSRTQFPGWVVRHPLFGSDWASGVKTGPRQGTTNDELARAKMANKKFLSPTWSC